MELSANTIQKYAKYDLSTLKKKAQHAFNAFIRARDTKGEIFPCISCQKPTRPDAAHASHYLSMGHHSALRYNEDNVHASCVRCNNFLSGNLINYRKYLVKKIGLEKVEELEAVGSRPHKWDRYSLIFIIETYKQKLKSL